MTAYLHELACLGPDECRCAVLYPVTETERMSDNGHYVGEATDTLESRTAGLSRFPEQSGRLRTTEGSP